MCLFLCCFVDCLEAHDRRKRLKEQDKGLTKEEKLRNQQERKQRAEEKRRRRERAEGRS